MATSELEDLSSSENIKNTCDALDKEEVKNNLHFLLLLTF